MSKFLRVNLLMSTVLLVAVAGHGQETNPAAAAAGGRISLDVVVTPRYGAPVAGLQQQDFTVFDNKVARPITSFAPVVGREAPMEMILLVDAVNAGYQTVAYERDGIDKFLMTDGSELAHPVTLAVLTDKGVEMQQSGSRDGKALKATLDQYSTGLRTIPRSAGFYGAEERLELSLGALNGLIAREEPKPGRKIIVWVSPGWPLLSGPGVQLDNRQQRQIFGQVAELSTRLRRARITLYSVDPLGSEESISRASYYKSFLKGVSKPGQVDPGDLGLQVLATQTGGLVLNSNNDIAAMLRQVMDDANAYYEISFEAAPGDHADDYHGLEVRVDKAGLIARTRSGYYAQP
jgi:VWFA-related protein